MPSPTDAVHSAIKQSLSLGSRKGLCSEGNGDVNSKLDSALIGANKLAEVTRCHVEYEPANNPSVGAQSMLKSKYIVLDTKGSNGAQNGNGHSLTGTNQDLSSREFSSNSSNDMMNGLHPGSKSAPLKGHANGINGSALKGSGLVANGLGNGVKKPLSNGTNVKGSGNGKGTINPDSVLPKPTQVLFDPDQVVLGWKRSFRPGAGMVNLGNTCYLNATLQALFHIPAFVDWLMSDLEHLKKCEQENGSNFGDCVICSMAKTLKLSQLHTYVKPFLVHNKIKMICRHFNHNSQEDAHEFMRHLLENMEKSFLKRYKHLQLDSYSKETTPINQIFGGYIRTEVKCRRCNYASTTFQHFQDLILDIRKASKVEEAMEQYFSNETLDGENSYRCEKCKTMVMAHKKFSIEKPPKVLCIQLKRFNVLGVKMQKTVEHRIVMDLRKYVHPKSDYAKNASLPYRLISMVSHMGHSAGSGHYTAVASNSSQTYYHFDDAQVRPLSQTSVLNHSAYILIYEMDPLHNKCADKPVSTSSVPVTSAADARNGFANGINKNGLQNLKGLPSVKDRDRVSFGLSPVSSTPQPRIIFNNNKRSDSLSVGPVAKNSAVQNGICNGEARTSNFIGPLQVFNGKHLGSASPKHTSLAEREKLDSLKEKESCVKSQGPLVPYECDDDSSSRESSLSPPSMDEKETPIVKATAPRDWQVTNSSSPSIHSESSNNSGASATGAHWNVTEDQPAPSKKIKDSLKDLKFERRLTHQSNLSDTELSNRTVKAGGKSDLRAKSVERGFNLSKDPQYFERSVSDEKHKRRKSSFSSESDPSSPPKGGGKHMEISDFKPNLNKEKIGTWSPKAATNRLQPSESTVAWEKSPDNIQSSRHSEKSSSSLWNADRSDTLTELKKMSHQGFGVDRVSSWSGERSQNSGRDNSRQESRKRPMDSYEEDLDRGRVKKIKKHHVWAPTPFQNYGSRSYSFNMNYNKNNRSYSRNRYHGHKDNFNKPYSKGFRDRDYTHSSANQNRFQRQSHF